MERIQVEDLQGAGDRWLDPAWLQSVSEWIGGRLAERGVAVHRLEQVQVRPWGSVVRVAASDGTYWFKGNAEGGALEAVLMPWLHERISDAVPATVAADPVLHWWIAADAGQSMAVAGAGASLDCWTRALTSYAGLQRRLEPMAAELVALGVPRYDPADLPGLLSRFLDDRALLMVGEEQGLTGEEHAALAALLPAYERWCAELSSAGIRLTLQHDDLSDANVCLAGDRCVVIDWADAGVAHPFASLIFPERIFREQNGLPADAAAVRRLRRRYLRAWTPEWDLATLDRLAILAGRVGIVAKAMSWKRALDGLRRSGLNDYYAAPEARWLRKLLAIDARS